MKTNRKLLKWFSANEAGSTAIEFSILILPLLAGVFGLIEMSYKSILQSELDDRIYAVTNAISINAFDYDDADEFMREYFCPEIGSTFMRCDDIEFGAMVLTERFFRYRSRQIANTYDIGCPGDPILVELNYPAKNVTIPFNMADIIERDGQKYYRSRAVIRREPMLSGGTTCI